LEELPLILLDDVPVAELGSVRRWWAGLSPDEQRMATELTDERQETCFFGAVSDEDSIPRVFGGRFLPHDDAWRFEDWEQDWREYLWEHSDVFLLTDCQSRSYRDGDGVLCVMVDWNLTRFSLIERPPSERSLARV